MQLFVGLGNPGAKYAQNRHNIGFMVVDEIAGDHGFTPWKSQFQGQVSSGTLGSEKVLLLKPATFMNLSGQSVGEAMRFYKMTPEDVTVFHDELDLAPSKVRVKKSGGQRGPQRATLDPSAHWRTLPTCAPRHWTSGPQRPRCRVCPERFRQGRGGLARRCHARLLRWRERAGLWRHGAAS